MTCTLAFFVFLPLEIFGERPRDFNFGITQDGVSWESPRVDDAGPFSGAGTTMRKKDSAEDLDKITELFEMAWDKHASVMNSSDMHYDGPHAELDEIRQAFRQPVKPWNESFVQHFQHLNALKEEMGRADDELQEHLDAYTEQHRAARSRRDGDAQGSQWSLSGAAKAVYLKVVWLGRMMLRLLVAVRTFVHTFVAHIGNLYVGPGVYGEIAEGCVGTTLTFAGDISYLYRNHQAAQLVPVMERVSVVGTVKETPSMNPITRLVNSVSDLMNRCEETRSRPAGQKAYSVSQGFAFWFTFKGCGLPLPHVRPSFGCGMSMGMGLMKCLATGSHRRQGEAGPIPSESAVTLLTKVSDVFNHLEDTDHKMKDAAGCINGLAFYTSMFAFPFQAVGALGSIRQCGIAPLKAFVKYLFAQPKTKAALKAINGEPTNAKVKAGKVDESALSSITDASAEAAGMEPKKKGGALTGPCSQLDCTLFVDVVYLLGGMDIGITCGPIAQSTQCVKDFIVNKMSGNWIKGVESLDPPAHPKDLFIPKETTGYCCYDKEATGSWKRQWTSGAGALCRGNALPVVKVKAAKGRAQGFAELDISSHWMTQQDCTNFPTGKDRLATVKLEAASNRGQLWKLVVPNVLGFNSVKYSQWTKSPHVIAYFEFMPSQPSHWCCCKPPKTDEAVDCKALPSASTQADGASSCKAKKLGLPVVKYASGNAVTVSPTFTYLSAAECESKVFLFTPIWIPKYRNNADRDNDIHSMTEGLATEEIQKVHDTLQAEHADYERVRANRWNVARAAMHMAIG